MKRRIRLTILIPSIVVFIYTIFGFLAFRVSFPIVQASRVFDFKSKYYDYAGATNIHSRLSNGSGTLSEIILAASHAKNDFIIFTDLNRTARPEAVEGYRNDLLVIWGGEFSYLTGHLLAFNLPSLIPYSGAGQAQIYFNDLLSQKPTHDDVVLIAAHPFLSDRLWPDLKYPGLDGLEVLNVTSVWREALRTSQFRVLWSILMLPFNPELAFLRLYLPPDEELKAWDKELETRPFIGMSGADATAKFIPWAGNIIPFPSYDRSLSLTKNHVVLKAELTGSYQSDKQKILEALSRGQFYFSVDLIGDPKGFYFEAKQGHQTVLMGSELTLSKSPVTLIAEIPQIKGVPFEIVLFRNSKEILAVRESQLKFLTNEPGAYRVVVRVRPDMALPDSKRWFNWIYSNAIRIKEANHL